MNKEEYEKERASLLDQAEKALKAGQGEKAEKLMEEVEELDSEYKATTPIKLPWMSSGTGINFDKGQQFSEAEKEKKGIFLVGKDGMKNYAMNQAAGHKGATGTLGAIIRGAVTGQWESEDLRNAVTTTSAGVLIPAVVSAGIIDAARALSLFASAEVPVIPMESDNVTISRVKKDASFAFKREGEAGKDASFELDGIKLESKTCYGYAYITLEAIRSSKNLDAIATQVFASAIAQATDKGMLYGQKESNGDFADYAPSGIMNDAEVLSMAAGSQASYDDIMKAAGMIAVNNGTASVWAVNAYTDQNLCLLKDGNGQYLNIPKRLEEMKKIVSNQLEHNESKGNDALVFDPAAMVIGIQNNIQIKIIEDEYCLKNGAVGFQIYTMQDCKVVRPKAICKITGMK